MSATRSQAQIAQEELEVLRLTRLGMNQRDIAKYMTDNGMPIAQPTVSRRATSGKDNYVVPEIVEAKRQIIAQLDTVMEIHAPAMVNGDTKAATIYMKALSEKSRVLGLEKMTEKPGEEAPTFNLVIMQQQERERQRAELTRVEPLEVEATEQGEEQ